MNLLFDLDGTLTDPYDGITRCIVHALTAMGRPAPPPARLRWCIGPPLRESLGVLLDTDDEKLVENALGIYRERFAAVGLYENQVYDGIPQVLQSLSDFGHTLFVATAKPLVFARRIVDHFGLARYFTGIYGCALDGTLGDKASLIAHILRSESIAAPESAMIGDRKHDMAGAQANGVPGFGALWGYGPRMELVASGAQACFEEPWQIATAFNA